MVGRKLNAAGEPDRQRKSVHPPPSAGDAAAGMPVLSGRPLFSPAADLFPAPAKYPAPEDERFLPGTENPYPVESALHLPTQAKEVNLCFVMS